MTRDARTFRKLTADEVIAELERQCRLRGISCGDPECTDPAHRVSWERIEPGDCDCHHPPMRHDRWVITWAGRDRLITDFAIKSYGRRHIEKLLRDLPPLPEQAWAADTHG